MSGRSLVSLIAGFGTGYLQGQKQKEEKARQDKIDQREQTVFDQSQKDRADEEAFNNKQAAIADALMNPTNTAMPAQQAPALSGINVPQADYTGQAPNAAANGIAMATTDNPLAQPQPTDAKPAAIWKVKEALAKNAILSTNSKNRVQGFQDLIESQKLKSEDYNKRINEANNVNDNGEALLALASNHDDNEMPYTDLKAEDSADGKSFTLIGKNAKDGSDFKREVTLKDGLTKKQWMAQDLFSRSSPEALMKYMAEQVKQTREDNEFKLKQSKNEKDNKLADAKINKTNQEIETGKVNLETLPAMNKAELAAKKASANASNASANSSNASAAKTRMENKDNKADGDKNLPADAKMMKYLVKAGVAKNEGDAYAMINKSTDEGLVIRSAMDVLTKDPDADVEATIKNARNVIKSAKQSPLKANSAPTISNWKK